MFEFNFGLEIIAFLTGLIFYKKIKPVIYRLVVPFLLVTIINEGLTNYGFYASKHLNKYILLNLFFLLEFIVLGIIYCKTASSFKANKLIIAIFSFSLIIQIILLLKIRAASFDPNYITLLSLTIIFFSFHYLYSIHLSTVVFDTKSDPMFWFSIGSIVVQFLLLLFINSLRIERFRNNPDTVAVFKSLNTIGNIFYYSCICYSFLCTSIFRRKAGI
jgi:hypothetical protein